MSFKSFSVGIWQSHPLQPRTPGLNVYIKKHVNYKVQTPTEGGELAQTGPPLQLGSWIWRETSPDYKRQIEDLFIPIIIPFIIIICLITKLRQIITNYDSYCKLRQLLHVTTEQSFITFSPSVRSFLKNILKIDQKVFILTDWIKET